MYKIRMFILILGPEGCLVIQKDKHSKKVTEYFKIRLIPGI
jgi:hypothetical protein